MENRFEKACKVFFTVTIVGLSLATLLKLLGLGSESGYLAAKSQLFPQLTYRYLHLIAVMLELLTLAVLIRGSEATRKLLAVLWLALVFITFRALMLYTGYTGPCTCLGVPLNWLPVPQKYLDNAATGLLIWCTVGSAGLLFFKWRLKAGPRSNFKTPELASTESV